MAEDDIQREEDLPLGPIGKFRGLGPDGYAVLQDSSQVALELSLRGAIAERLSSLDEKAFLASPLYSTVAEGLAATDDGDQFQVIPENPEFSSGKKYKNEGGVAVELSDPLSASALAAIDGRIKPAKTLGKAVAFAVTDPATGQSPFLIMANEKGSVVNPHFQEVEAAATEAMQDRVRVEPTPQALAWAATQKKANGDTAVLLGVRSTDGHILNPSFKVLWDAVFGGTVSTGDLSEANSIIMHGPSIYAVEGRSFDLFASSLLPNRNSGYGRSFALQSVNGSGQPLNLIWRDQVRVRADELGTSARLKLINDGIANTEFSKDLTVVMSAASKVATPRVAMIGDSITNGAHLMTEDRFDGYDVTPYFMGTRRPTLSRDSWAEGRGGWGATDFCYDRTTYIPLPEGQEAGALAAQTDNRNPFIRPEEVGDDPAMVRNGYIFDYRYYLDRFSMADPDIVVLNLGTNDIAQIGLPDGPTRARDCIDIIMAQIQAACPDAIIGIGMAMKGNSIVENPRWYQGYAQLWLHWHETYGAVEGVHVLSTHAMAPDRLVFPMTTTATNAQTGQVKQILDDGIHPDSFIGYHAYSEGVFSFIHAMA